MKKLAILASLALMMCGPMVSRAAAQGSPPSPPGQGRVTRNQDCSVTIEWNPSSTATTYALIANYNGAQLGIFPVGPVVTIRTPPLPDGDYLIGIIAINANGQTLGGPTSFIHACGLGGPLPIPAASGPPTTPPLWTNWGASGNTVTLTWVNTSNAAGTDVEAIIQATGQTVSLHVGPGLGTLSVPGVPAGNFLVRLRNTNAFGVGPWAEYRIVVVGLVLGVGDVQFTLTWNTLTDIDLHVIEPNGAHVYYASKNGTTARLDHDNTSGYGPENIYVAPGTAAPGIYQVYIVHYSRSIPTNETISIILRPGTSSQQVALFTRSTNTGNPGVGFNVANVDVRNGIITETTGTHDRLPLMDAKEASK